MNEKAHLPPHHMPMEVAKVLTRQPMVMIILAIMIHHRRPILVETMSPMKAVNIEGIKKDAA
jgi:hypothetical protein